MCTENKRTRINRLLRICNVFFVPLFIIGLCLSFTLSYDITMRVVYAAKEPYAEWDVIEIEGFEETSFNDIEFLNVTHGWLVGSLNRPAILHSNNSGITWTVQYENENHRFYSLSVIGPNNIWAGAGGRLFYSNDCGNSWSNINLNLNSTAPQNVEFYNDSYGYTGSVAGLFVTTDGGLTWQERVNWPDETYTRDICISPSIIRIATYQCIYLSNDTGLTWEIEYTRQTKAISFVEDNIVWAAHYDSISRFDGNSWTVQIGVSLLINYARPSIWDIEFLDENIGWTVGTSPAVAHTVDGGRTWYRQSISDSLLVAIDVYNESHCWAAGWRGYVARTTTGNLFGPKLYRGFYIGYLFGSGGRTIPYEPFFVALCVTLSFGLFVIYKRRRWLRSQLNILHPPSIQ